MDACHGHHQRYPVDDDLQEQFGGISGPYSPDRTANDLDGKGRAAAVLQDAESYQRLLDIAAEASVAEGVRQGLEDLEMGRTRPASEVFAEMRAAESAGLTHP